MNYEVVWTERAVSDLEELSGYTVRILLAWVRRNLSGCEDPYAKGTHLPGGPKGAWRYSVGSYRLVAQIGRKDVQILGVTSGMGIKTE